jgi:hypothetical protein
MAGIPEKIPNVLKLIRSRVQTGEFIILPHVITRQAERNISVADIIFVLKNGEHESEKDEFKEAFRSWNYAIRGKTIDDRTLRIAVAFDAHDMLIITVIPLGRRRR